MQETSIATYKLKYKIKDDTLNVDHIDEYGLSLQIGTDLFRFCVTDFSRNRCLLLEDYYINDIQPLSKMVEVLNEIYENHHILQAGFWKTIKLAIKTPNFSIVPQALFEADFAKDYLNLNCSIKPDNNEEILYYKQNSSELVNIFSADKSIIQFFDNAYHGKKLKIVHHTSALIEGIMMEHVNIITREMYLFTEKDQLTIVIKKNRKLEFCNSFFFSSPEDFVYYVMFVAEQLKFNPELQKITIWGDLTPDSLMFAKLKIYVKTIEFGTKPSSLYFGYNFDEIQDHNFFDLYNLYLCE